MAVDGNSHAMTIADYIAFGVLIVLALSAVVVMYARQSRVKQNEENPKQ